MRNDMVSGSVDHVCGRKLCAALLGAVLLSCASSANALPPVDNQNATKGYWDKSPHEPNAPYDWLQGGVTGVHMTLFSGASSPGGNDFRLMFYYGGGECFGGYPRVWNFGTYHTPTEFGLIQNYFVEDNLFCSGHVSSPDGRPVVIGGTETGAGEGSGQRSTWIFDVNQPGSNVCPNAPQWREANGDPDLGYMQYNRWYPTATSLADGRVLATSGRRFRELMVVGGEPAGGAVGSLVGRFGVRSDFLSETTSTTGEPTPARSLAGVIFDKSDLNTGPYDQEATGWHARWRILMFGGKDNNSGGNALSDCWRLERTQNEAMSWAAVQPVPSSDSNNPSPVARFGHAVAYDQINNCMWVFGGTNGSAYYSDLWMLRLRERAPTPGELANPPLPAIATDRWERVSIAGPWPSARTGAVLGYAYWTDGQEPPTREGWLYVAAGQTASGTYASGTDFAYRLQVSPFIGQWEAIPYGANAPAPRAYAVGAVEEASAIGTRFLVFGGNDGSQVYSDLRALDIHHGVATPTWSLVKDGSAVTGLARTKAAGVYEGEFQQFVVCGGLEAISGLASDEVWSLSLKPGSTGSWDNRSGIGHPEAARVKLAAARSGCQAVYDNRWIDADVPEIFSPATELWTSLTGASKFLQLYPHMYLIPTGPYAGKVYASNEIRTHILDTSGTGQWVADSSLPSSMWDSGFFGGSSVMYRPGKVMKCGSEDGAGQTFSKYIDLTVPVTSQTPSWNLADDLPEARVKHNLTLLPDGKALLTGGMGTAFKPATGINFARLWNPDAAAGSRWSAPLDSDPTLRDYHSTAILLPDGRVLTAGGWDSPGRGKASIFWPPYLFNAAGVLASRPTMARVNAAEVGYGATFKIRTPDACDLLPSSTTGTSGVVLMRPGAVTHQFNQSQRYIPLQYTVVDCPDGSDLIAVTSPADGNAAPPGDYLLYIVRAGETPGSGIPSVATWLRVSGSAGSAFADPPSLTTVSGHYPDGTVWTAANGPYILPDLGSDVVLDGTLTIQAGTELRFGAGRKILVPAGKRLIINGTKNAPVLLRAHKNAASSSWSGLELEAWSPGSSGRRGTLDLNYVDIRDATIGVLVKGLTATNLLPDDPSPDSILVKNTVFSHCGTSSIKVESVTGSPSPVRTLLAIRGCVFAPSQNAGGSPEPANITYERGDGRIESNLFVGGSSPTTTGILVNSGSETPTPTLVSNTIRDRSSAIGIGVTKGQVTIVRNSIINMKYGSQVSAVASASIGLGADPQSDNILFANVTAGIHRLAGSGSGTVTVRNNQIGGSPKGVYVLKGAPVPDLGVAGDDGRNNFQDTQPGGYCIYNGSTTAFVSAMGNFFGPCPAPLCAYGNVLIDNPLCTAPSSARRGSELVRIGPEGKAPLLVAVPTPNPTRGRVVVGMTVGRPALRIEVQVLDVSGRLIRGLGSFVMQEGVGSVEWDGRGSGGRLSPRGICFLRVLGEGLPAITRKVLLVR